MSLSSIRARVKAATEGPWRRDDGSPRLVMAKKVRQIASVGMWGCVFSKVDERNAEFIAHARADIPLLLKVAEAAKKLDGFEPEDIDCEVWEADYQEAVKVLRAALAELEAAE